MEEILKYTSVIALCGTAISFVIGLIKWIDQRNREQEQKQHEAFHRTVCVASDIDETGRNIKMVQQIAAIYQLQAYKKYAFASIPVLKQLKFEYGKMQGEKDRQLEVAVNETIEALSKNL